MHVCSPQFLPIGAAVGQWASRFMEVILHVGAHRTGTTGFQDYLRRHRDDLAQQKVAFWGPGRTRRGLFAGILPGTEASADHSSTERGQARVRLQLDKVADRGIQKVVISDENMIGTVRANVGALSLYENVRVRMERFAGAFDGYPVTILFSPRSLDLYWCSALAYSLTRGVSVPSRDNLRLIANSRRGWRDVIADLSAAMPHAKICVLPFEQFSGRPEAFLGQGTGVAAPQDADRTWLNKSPTLPELRRVLNERGGGLSELPFGMGRWNPFDNEEHAALREMYADDMMWLTSGADGLATLLEDRPLKSAEQKPPQRAQEKGQFDEFEERKMARPG